MTSARLTVLGRAHIHSLMPLCHSLLANPSFPPFISVSISHPSITHHILSLSLSSSLSLGYCSFSEHLSLSWVPFITYLPTQTTAVRATALRRINIRTPGTMPFPASIHLAQGCQTRVLEESCPFKIWLFPSFSLFSFTKLPNSVRCAVCISHFKVQYINN